jgi:subtilisin family serine protease
MKSFWAIVSLASMLGLIPAYAADTPSAGKPRIEKAADLPRFTYEVPGSLEEYVRSADRFASLSAALRRDTESALARYEIADKATQRDLIGLMAVLDYLDGRYDSALARADQVRQLQEKPADRLLSGLQLRAMASAAKQHPLGSDAWKAAVADAIARELSPLPFDVIANDIRRAKAGAETIGEGLVMGQVRGALQPVADAGGGKLSNEFASGLARARFALLNLVPLRTALVDVFTRYLDAHKIEKPDIWAQRDVVLPASGPYRPVTLAVWDSGVDTALFKAQLVRGDGNKPAVIAFDKYARPSDAALLPLSTEMQAKLPQMRARTKGFSDMQSNIESPEASDVKQLLSTLKPERFKEVVEELRLAANHSHGTHVAGIAMAGNPHARLAVGRIEFGHTIRPDPCPSLEQTQRDAASHGRTVDFFKREGVRVVNMSWGGSVRDVEDELEQCGIGKTPEERKAIGREYFEITKKALTQAMAGAPGILFVAAAGNSNSDATFIESLPADIVLPNLLTVGAVDRAGDEASFTSYGPTVKVHANGYQVESYLPGGVRVALSGTSMAAPQVTNLAAKLLAAKPSLTPPQLIDAITSTAERTSDGRRVLVHPKAALAKVTAGG